MDREIQQRHPHLKKYVAVAIGVATAVAVVAWAVSRMTSDTYSTTTAGMTFGDVTEGEFRDYIRLNGRVETGTTVQVSALETGIVESRLAEEGAMVEAGDVIITLHNPTPVSFTHLRA
ncbi:MAG: efflux RND transporter periplasmic adaptor subunit, partial [Paramuribaculum sp.]